MRIRVIPVVSLLCVAFAAILFHCKVPTPPPGADAAKVKLFLKSSTGKFDDMSITDTIGNNKIQTIGVVLYQTPYIDSTSIIVTCNNKTEFTLSTKSKKYRIDTVYFPVSFDTVGEHKVIATSIIPGQPNSVATASIFIVNRLAPNQKPSINVPDEKVVIIGETVTFKVSATDPDSSRQTVTIDATKKPQTASFTENTFSWKPELADTGTHYVVFVAKDNGTPVLSDTDSVTIKVSATAINRKPVWDPKTVTLQGVPGTAISYALGDKYSDPDQSDSVAVYLVPSAPVGDTIIGKTYSFTPAVTDKGIYPVHIVAKDKAGLTDTLTLTVIVGINDNIAPVINRISPLKDSLVISSSSYKFVVSAKDESGIASVVCVKGSDTVKMSKNLDTLYSAVISGLVPSVWSKVTIIAKDSSLAANTTPLTIHVKCDTTIADNVPPIIALLSPLSDTIISTDSLTISATCKDKSGISSFIVKLDTVPFLMSKVSPADSIWTGTVKGFKSRKISTVSLIGVDSAAAKNSDSVIIRVLFDNDTTKPAVTRVTPLKDSTVTNQSTYTLSVSCTDQSGIASVKAVFGSQMFTGVKGAGDTWTIGVTGLIANVNNEIQLSVTDSSIHTNTTTLKYYVKYDTGISDADTTKPLILKIAPSKDSTITNESSYTIVVNCTDQSGIMSVIGKMGSQTFTGVKGTGDSWSITVTGLVENTYNKITVTALDNSQNGNFSTIPLYIKYDSKVGDVVPPRVLFVTPGRDTIIGVDSLLVKAICTDLSKISSLVVKRDTVSYAMTRTVGNDSLWIGVVKGLANGVYSTIKLIATDSSAARNKDSVSIRVKYDSDTAKPVVTRVTPAKDSVSTNDSSYTITITCIDPSGISLVKGTSGTRTFTGVKNSTANAWTIAITGLAQNVFSNVIVTVTDSSLRGNTTTLNYYIKCDPTMSDNTPPRLYFTKPGRDTVLGVDTFVVTAVCVDPSKISSLVGKRDTTTFGMTKTTVDSIWSGVIRGLPSGSYSSIMLIATDSSTLRNKDTVSVRIKYDGDTIKPSLTRVTPTGESASTNANSYTITVNCTDASGVASVVGTMGTQTFTGARGAGNAWSIAVTGLSSTAANAVVVTATDSSLRSNKSILNYSIVYDPTMLDTIGPTITDVSGPASGTTVTSAVVDIVKGISDPSGIDSVYWTKNGGVKKNMTPVTGNAGQYSLKDTLTEGRGDTLVITAVDKATRHSRSTQIVIFRYIKIPSITAQPVSQTVCAGGRAFFSVTATGTAPLSYQWRIGAVAPFTNIGGNYPACTLSAAATTILSCLVNNGASITSSLCTLTVNAAPVVSAISPSTSSTCSGTNVTFSLTSTGVTGYSWYRTGSTTSLGTTATYSTSTAGSYYCIVSNASGCLDTSPTAVLTVNAVPNVTAISPATAGICPSGSVNLSLTSTGVSGYNWYVTGSSASLATTPTYSANAAGSYYCIVSNASGCLDTSPNATISLSAVPSVSAISPTNSSVCSGTPVTFSLVSTGATGYKWYQVGNSTVLGTGATFSASSNGSYYCTVSNAAGCTAVSPTAVLTVNDPPVVSAITPISSTVCPGGNTRFTLTVSPDVTNYNWYRVGSTSSLGTSSSYTATSAGSYYCIVGNASGCRDTSPTASFSVNTPPSISISGASPACSGTNVVLSVPTGPNWSYLWSRGSTQLSTQSSCRLNNITVGQAGVYTCVVTDANGCSSTATANLTVNPLIVSPAEGSETHVCITDAATVDAPCGVTYEWWVDPWGSGTYTRVPDGGADLVGQGTPTLRSNTPAGSYVFCTVTNAAGQSVNSGTFFFGQMFCP